MYYGNGASWGRTFRSRDGSSFVKFDGDDKWRQLHLSDKGTSIGDVITVAELYGIEWQELTYGELTDQVSSRGEADVYSIVAALLYGSDYPVRIPDRFVVTHFSERQDQ